MINLAEKIRKLTGASIVHSDNPRNEAAFNDLDVTNDSSRVRVETNNP